MSWDSEQGNTFMVPSREEAKIFKEVNRDDEDALVRAYRQTGDKNALNKLYAMREPTLWVWARKFAHLDNVDDMFSEFCIVWLNCVNKYVFKASIRPVRMIDGSFVYEDGKVKTVLKRTPFNTYLYTALRNKAWNIIKKQHSKRVLDGNGDPVAETMLSLDMSYGDEGDDVTLLDSLVGTDGDAVSGAAGVSEIIKDVSDGNKDVMEVLQRFTEQPYLTKITTACKLQSGSLHINRSDRRILAEGGQDAVSHMAKLLKSTGTMPKRFRILNFSVQKSRVFYEIYIKDDEIVRKVTTALRKFREKANRSHKIKNNKKVLA